MLIPTSSHESVPMGTFSDALEFGRAADQKDRGLWEQHCPRSALFLNEFHQHITRHIAYTHPIVIEGPTKNTAS